MRRLSCGIISILVMACGDGEEVVLVEGTLQCPLAAGADVCTLAETTKPALSASLVVRMQRAATLAEDSNDLFHRTASACEAIASDLGAEPMSVASTPESVAASCARAGDLLAKALAQAKLVIRLTEAKCLDVQSLTSCAAAQKPPSCAVPSVVVTGASSASDERLRATIETNVTVLLYAGAKTDVVSQEHAQIMTAPILQTSSGPRDRACLKPLQDLTHESWEAILAASKSAKGVIDVVRAGSR